MVSKFYFLLAEMLTATENHWKFTWSKIDFKTLLIYKFYWALKTTFGLSDLIQDSDISQSLFGFV